MIKSILGNVGSGKTASIVRYMRDHPYKIFVTNIDVKGKNFSHVIKLKANMIIKKEVTSIKKNGEENFKLSLNIDFWKELLKKHKTLNVVIDEAHIFFNPRRSMSKLNILMTDFLALLRRVLGSSDGTGELILITQLSRRLDIIAKEMTNEVTYCIHHFITYCKKCGLSWQESNEDADRTELCPECNSYHLGRRNSTIEIYKFTDFESFEMWSATGQKSYFKRYLITDIEDIFGNYETLQFNDLFTEY